MNGSSQHDVGPPSSHLLEDQPPKEGRIWKMSYSDSSSRLYLAVKTAATGTFTTAQLCHHVRSSREIIEGAKDVEITCCNDSECSESNLKAIGEVLHDFKRFDDLCIFGFWTDGKASVLLHHMPKTKIRKLLLNLCEREAVPARLAELQRGSWLGSLRYLSVWNLELDGDDCRTLGRLLQSRQQGEKFHIEFHFCSFPSLTGYLVAAEALIGRGPFSFVFDGNTVKDSTVPSSVVSVISKSHGDFYNRFEREDEGDTGRFTKAARDHLHRYADFNYAGWCTLFRPGNTASVKRWVGALCNDKVRDSVDYIFHFLSVNPVLYASAARSGSAVAAQNVDKTLPIREVVGRLHSYSYRYSWKRRKNSVGRAAAQMQAT